MKIMNPTVVVLACLLASAAAKRDFKPDHSDHGQEHIMTAADFDGDGAKMRVCPSDDCTSGNDGKFKPKKNEWTDIVTAEMYGVNVSSTSFIVVLKVGNTDVNFNLTASIFQGNATVEYGTQTISVPAGALKFTVDIAGWPFHVTEDTLTLAVSLDAKGPKGKALGKPEKKSKGSAAKTDRFDLGESMFMDVPTYAFVDGEETALLNSSVIESAGSTAFEWVFPYFESTLHYDPVLGDESTTSASSSTSTSSSGDATEAPSTSTAAKLSLSGLAAAGLAVLAFGFF